jgi:hypothetical protein
VHDRVPCGTPIDIIQQSHAAYPFASFVGECSSSGYGMRVQVDNRNEEFEVDCFGLPHTDVGKLAILENHKVVLLGQGSQFCRQRRIEIK